MRGNVYYIWLHQDQVVFAALALVQTSQLDHSPHLQVNNIVRSTQELHKAEMSSESWPPQLKYVIPAISSHPRNITEILNLPHPFVGNG